MTALFHDLRDARLTASDDEVKTDLELVCAACGTHVCDAEDGDTLDVLARTFRDHADRHCAGRDVPVTVTARVEPVPEW